ncbi:MAG: hypothetical protein ACM3NO_06635, partial [Deltaproteobacteria bacterium]
MKGIALVAVPFVLVSAAAPLTAGQGDLPPLPAIDYAGAFPVVQRELRAAEASVRHHPSDAASN